MVVLDAARRGTPSPRLARWMLAAGIGATLAANVASGLWFGPVGALVAAWPALAAVGSYELLMLVVRGTAVPAVTTDVLPLPPELARAALERSIAAGQPPSQGELTRWFGMSRSRAAGIAREVTAAANGHAAQQIRKRPARSISPTWRGAQHVRWSASGAVPCGPERRRASLISRPSSAGSATRAARISTPARRRRRAIARRRTVAGPGLMTSPSGRPAGHLAGSGRACRSRARCPARPARSRTRRGRSATPGGAHGTRPAESLVVHVEQPHDVIRRA
jgi:hypothetical protein